MKKILLATSIIALGASIAAAEVKVGGDARMGIINNGTDNLLTSRFRVKFSASGESDSGLSFGASARAEQAGIAENGKTSMNEGSVYISGAFGKLWFGDNDSAANTIVGHVDGVGLTGLNDTNELGYLGQTDTSALYRYDLDGISLAVSSSQALAADEAISVGASYKLGDYQVAVGYEDATTNSATYIGLSGAIAGFNAKAVLKDTETNEELNYALSVGYSVSGIGLTGFYALKDTKASPTAAVVANDAMGLGASYDLGGGAKVLAGYAKEKGKNDTFDLGVSMSF